MAPQELERVRRGLRALVQLIEPGERKIVFTDFTDTIGTGVAIDIEAVTPGVDKARLTMKIRRFLEKHKDHIALLKLQRAEQLTATDLSQLEKMFVAEGVPIADGEKDINSAGGLGLFLRSLIGLDRKAAKNAFSGLLDGRLLTAAQNEFIDFTIKYLTERGAIEPSRFYESPFTDLSDLGINGVFPGDDAKKIIDVVENIRRSAVA